MFKNLNGQKVSPVAHSPVDKVAQAVTNQPTGVDLYGRFALAGAIGVSKNRERREDAGDCKSLFLEVDHPGAMQLPYLRFARRLRAVQNCLLT